MPSESRGLVYRSGRWEVDIDRRTLLADGVAVPVGSRAFEIIETLVRAGGALVTKDALMAQVWPGLAVGENTLQVHISALRKALGPDRNLLQTNSGRGYRLAGDWQVRQAEGSEVRAASSSPASQPTPSGLPVASSALIGRAAAVQLIPDLLSAYRVVTLTGPGGIGKTALALEVARLLESDFADGAWLVELAASSKPAQVASTVAAALGINPGGDLVSAEAIGRALAARQVLVVLDNCEHVVDEAADLAGEIVRWCPRASVLATSREALRIDGEYVFRLSPLDVPPATPELAGDFRDYGAVRLFIRRAQAADAAFEPMGPTLAAIATICRRLDGIPLAIEFAAARVAALGVHEVAARLDDRFALLTAGRRTALPRHQTLRATLDWSYGLLTESEKHCLRNLAVFPAGFTLDAAAFVMGTAGRTLSRHLDDISNLVAKSLVTPDGSAPADRWRLLETVHAYAQGKLSDADEAAHARRRHAAFYRDLVMNAAPASALEPTTAGLAICVREIDNVRAAIDWAFSAEGDASLGIVLTAEYMPVWLHQSLMGECRERTERALACPPTTASASRRTSMLLNIGLAYALLYTGGAAEKTWAALAVALTGAQELDDIVAQNYVLWALWACHVNGGEIRNAQRVAGQFSRLAIRSGSPARRLVAERLIGATMHYRGNQPRARLYLQAVLDDQHRIVDGRHAVWFRYDIRVMAQASLARVLCLQGLTDQAKEMAAASRDGAEQADHPLMLCHSLAEAACSVALMVMDLDAATGAVADLIAAATGQGAEYWRIMGRCMEGVLLIRRGEFRQGCTLLGAAIETCQNTGWTLYFPTFMGVLAEGLAEDGNLAQARIAIERALRSADQGGEQWAVADLLRIKAGLLMRSKDDRSVADAEDCLLAACRLARRQGAVLWEQQAVTDLARLRDGSA